MRGGIGNLIRYHAVIPFKHYQLIAKQIDWAEKNKYREGEYDLANRNCEHFANMFVYGINYSSQVEERFSSDRWKYGLFNNGKNSTIKLSDEIITSNNELEERIGEWYEEIETKIEILSKQDCKIM